jgi:hypothetical protein
MLDAKRQERIHMRNALILTLAIVVWSTAASAQERRGYVEGAAGLTAVTGSTTGNADGEIGVRVAPRVSLFGNMGRVRDMQSSALQNSLNDAVTALAATDLTATATAKTPAWYTLGGARIDLPNRHMAVTPYVFGGLGFARLTPSARFLYQSGTTLTGNLAATGDDITADVVSNGLFTAPVAKTGLMLRTGGGLQVPLGKYLLGNVDYSVSRISADKPLHSQDLTFGVGFRF